MCSYDRWESTVLYTFETATQYVIAELEAKGTATREDFDVPAIVATSHAIAESWDFQALDRHTFWSIAASNLRA
ncbi:hypothetical protein A5780_09480 [Nocardia sp. 852002-20019_SCH5090214]|jgi:hypothetical protein|nr:hypothetical protein [Nocardia cerradoensis]OBA46036.1 hypothetical protein A5789_06035 [Nocardia sp. 852002-51101_SCH5132738]OBA67808.1 hypothetical protein A5780_09480 [Nocardia sp. 852002-20019_SCH5090214]OBB43190.1 hypothetical protein A5748_28755 [Nocardia sp. 852002-51244_SCH5132740]OBF82903.1 hypothetical protein A9X06_18185 [Mycobacterium sp. 852002-51759_SCH5129042]